MENDIEKLVYQVIFKKSKRAEKEIRKRAKVQGIKLTSTQKLYEAKVQNKWSGFFTVPAINIRTLTFDTARAVLRQAIKQRVGAFVFELARSEIDYTDQPMSEYVPVILAAAIKEGFKGYLFFQGDHFQVKAEKFFSEKKSQEIEALKKLIKDSIEAGVYNIDIDSSTLVRLDKEDLPEQQKFNYELTAQLTSFIRSLEPRGITISVGGEVGEIGGKNSTPEDLRVFMEGYNRELAKFGDIKGLIKIAVQTGATHGGIVGPSGKLIKADVDFETLKKLSSRALKYGMAGAVQHGASTLSEEYFDKFPETGAVEIHLATAFQNIVLDSPYFPKDLKEKIYNWLIQEQVFEKKLDQTEEQFIYKTRKKALGPFKKEILKIPQKNIDKISEELEKKFVLLFQKLGVADTLEIVNKFYSK
ncbi:MAG: aldolase [Candidatus Nealsonbacteria bacterium CG_4_9_14_0_2_um_filter_37_38]|nr:MAG: aldolase [Candidatus Nealsonbacteria bacterium CG11_big_fil_rev_8_21_14_0_20_37_68]PIW91974.1 MAG: aldolase [Candidatus Nealsonbacteria bacterium CG_4_8_14_3_um_filter_37_23]PJC51934.1 MAG: aldolase [Candidatus Nealsonbacteria bacterium CG_4_9_14_0_2_um_filter_37_38]